MHLPNRLDPARLTLCSRPGISAHAALCCHPCTSKVTASNVVLQFLCVFVPQVASEDTVLYTAQRYVDNISDPVQHEHVVQQLAPLIRCQHLSLHWLATAVASQDAGRCVLAPLRPLLPKLLMVASANHGKGSLMQNSKPLHDVSGAPASWLEPSRQIKPV